MKPKTLETIVMAGVILLVAVIFALGMCGCGESQAAPPRQTPPVIGNLSPATITQNPDGGTVTINGFNFKGNAVVLVNGYTRITTVLSSTQANFQLLKSDVANPGFLTVQVANLKPKYSVSNAVQFQVCAPLEIVTTKLPDGQVGVPYFFQLQAKGGCLAPQS